jgi:hypothetical protein
VFPRALVAVLDVAESQDVVASLARLEHDPLVASPECRAVVGRLLWTVAGLRVDAEANLMPLPLSHSERRAVQAAAERLIERPPDATVAAGRPTGFAARLHRLAGDTLAHVSEPAVLRQTAAAMAVAVREGVHPESPLQAWWAAVQLLEQRRSTAPLLDSRGEPLAPSLQLAGWEALLQLDPGRALVDLLLQRFEALQAAHPGLRTARAAALLRATARADDAQRFAQAWVVEQPDEPEALFCRMEAHLRRSTAQLDERLTKAALDDAMAAVQQADDRSAALRRACAILDRAAADAPAGFREKYLALAAAFRALPP